MEQQKSLVKSSVRLPGFVEQAFESIEKMKEYSKLLLDSKIVPDHYYEKGSNGKPDYTKGNIPKVMMVLQKGYQLDIDPQMSLEVIVPINGVLSIKANSAKALIMRSGKVVKGSWNEKISGTIKDGTYTVSITAQRVDTGEKLTREFSVDKAKRSGLWIDDDILRKQDGWKFKYSPWYRFQDRMIYHRALSNLANDLFGDVINNMYTTEEAQYFPQDQSLQLSTLSGAKIEIPDKNFSQERSQNLTNKASDMIDKKNRGQQGFDQEKLDKEIESRLPKSEEEKQQRLEEREKVNDTNEEVRQYPATPEESEAVVIYTEDQLKAMKVNEMRPILQSSQKMVLAVTQSDRQNTNKKYREIILAFQDGKIDEWIDAELKRMASEKISVSKVKEDETVDNMDIPMESIKGNEEGGGNDDIQANADFDNKEETIPGLPTSNNKNIEVPGFAEGKEERTYDDKLRLFSDLLNVGGINSDVFQGIIRKYPQLQQYNSKEDFCSRASAGEVNLLINSVE